MLSLITDRRRLAPGADDAAAAACVVEQARQAASAGVDLIQVRERDLEARSLATLVTAVLTATRGFATRVVVNDRVDVALATGADGVHLRSDSLEARHVRAVAPPHFVVGRSVHALDDVQAAGPVDYLLAGTVWPTASKPGDWAFIGIDGLRAIAHAATVPVLAIGGIVPDRFAEVAASGAAGVAGIGLFIGDGHPCRIGAVQEVVAAFHRAFGTGNMPPSRRRGRSTT